MPTTKLYEYGCQAPYVYIQGMHKYNISISISCAIFHVVYSSNISSLIIFMHFRVSVRATLMEEPSHQRCNDIIDRKKEGAKTEHRKNKRKKRSSLPDYPSCSHVMLMQVEGMERIAPAPPQRHP
jgi:hypothetical protein